MRRKTIPAVILAVAIFLLIGGFAIALFVIPGGNTAEEVIRDSVRIKTMAQWMILVGGIATYTLYRLDRDGRW